MKDGNELFELCKQVYEATGWTDTYLRWVDTEEPWIVNADEWHRNTKCQTDLDMSCLYPLYDSDYLLEKLPGLIGVTSVHIDDVHTEVRKLRPGESPSGATYQSNVKGLLIGAGGDTPLQVLLKLTLKLHEEGLL